MEWISVNDRMPELGKVVLVYSTGGLFHAFWDRLSSNLGDWYDITTLWIIEDVTHWTNLPV